MRGKKPGFLGLRKLLNRNKRDIPYPKVYNVRLQEDIEIRPISTETPAMPETLDLCMETLSQEPHTRTFQQATSDSLQCISSNATQHAEEMSCYQIDPKGEEIAFLNIDTSSQTTYQPRVDTISLEVRIPATFKPNYQAVEPKVRNVPLAYSPKVRGGAMLARSLPFFLHVIPINQLSKKLIIRYRSAVFKQLNIKPVGVKFIGVVTNLPKAPLSVLRYQEDTNNKNDRVLVRIRGATNPLFGRRSWVFIQMAGKPDYLPVTVKEEEE